MISKTVGINLKEIMKNRPLLLKLAASLMLSNIFFYLLFSSPEAKTPEASLPAGTVEVEVQGTLLTPFEERKHVLLYERARGLLIDGHLSRAPSEEGRLTVSVREDAAAVLLQHASWDILPYLKNFKRHRPAQGESHEIRY